PNIWYSPLEFVRVCRVVPVCTSRTVTLAPPTRAPLESVTVPRIVPRSVPCPNANVSRRRTQSGRAAAVNRGFIENLVGGKKLKTKVKVNKNNNMLVKGKIKRSYNKTWWWRRTRRQRPEVIGGLRL